MVDAAHGQGSEKWERLEYPQPGNVPGEAEVPPEVSTDSDFLDNSTDESVPRGRKNSLGKEVERIAPRIMTWGKGVANKDSMVSGK